MITVEKFEATTMLTDEKDRNIDHIQDQVEVSSKRSDV